MIFIQKVVLFLAIVLFSTSANADSVPMASIFVNGKLVRKILQDGKTPHLVNLSGFNIGDTLRIKVWTDTYAQHDAVVKIKNLQSNHIDTLSKKNEFLITSDLLEHEHLIVVTFQYSHPTEFQFVWEIFKVIPDRQIEQVYKSVNELKNFLLSDQFSIHSSENQLFGDSVTVNFKKGTKKHSRIVSDTINFSSLNFTDLLNLNELEISYFEKINPVDRTKMYTTGIHGFIDADYEDLSQFSFSFGDINYKIVFHFDYENGRYQLRKCFYSVN